ncbi:SfnB family sulfur acquisition oxidoreductase [Pseudomonas sp. SZMC_28357]|uniref:SfnB family sulfur acquisition oxidoreductase n=1 Tax=Pseudomonas sp. SZMC_28357 TaxID=3074380 RepID=UPI0028728CC6|nr:SfnB family sulfur acquisition oxidoreductase [Pseudomonas sp. SZMC_28357]MDR9754409.1 SfnB family sulfur acquisition oxidoreductase [Pseudomonas sp. SZMC_28357]
MTQALLDTPHLQVAPPTSPAHIIRSDDEAIAVAQRLAAQFKLNAQRRDVERQLPWQELEDAARSGLLAIRVPREYGGAHVSYLTLTRVVAAIGEADASIGQLLLSIILASSVIEAVGREEQKQLFFGKILQGYRWGNGHAEGGSLPAGTTRTRITREGDHYRVNGAKAYSTGALFSQLISIGCVDEDGLSKTAVLDRHAPGLTIIDDWDGFGQRTTASGTLLLDNVRVEHSHVLDSELGKTSANTYGIPDLFHSALDLGIARAAFKDTLDYVREHARPYARTGVEAVAEDPYVLAIIGDLHTRIHAGEAVLERAAALFDQVTAEQGPGPSLKVSSALATAKILTTEAALLASNKLFQLGGASSTRLEYGFDRHWRNARTHTVHDPVAWKFNLIGKYHLLG